MWGQELEEATDDDEESLLSTCSFPDIRFWEAGADRVPSRTLGTLGMSKATAGKNKEERIWFQPFNSAMAPDCVHDVRSFYFGNLGYLSDCSEVVI